MTRSGTRTWPLRRPSLSGFKPEVRRALPTLIAFRLISAAGHRYPFTFLPALARGSGLSIETVGAILSARDLTGMTAPLIGRFTDRLPRPRVMFATSLLLIIGLFLAAIGPLGLLIGFLLFGISKLTFDIAMNSWIGDNVAYERRGRAIGLVELSWAGAALLGLPVLGLAIDHVGWWAASVLLGSLAVPLAVLIRQRTDTGGAIGEAPPRVPLTFGRPVVLTLVAFGLIALGSQFLMLGHGLWLEDTYRFEPARIGFAAFGIGAVEAVASIAVSTVADRVGKRNAVIAGLAVFLAGLIGLAATVDPPLLIGLGLLGLAFLGFEFGLVSSFSLITELDPAARAQMLGWAFGTSTALRALGSLVGVWLYVNRGFGQLMVAAAVCIAICLLVMIFGVREPATPPTASDLVN